MNFLNRRPKDLGPLGAVRYEIVVDGRLGPRLANWFDGFDLVDDAAGCTTLLGCVDQAALHAALTRIRDLGVPLVSVRRLQATRPSDDPER